LKGKLEQLGEQVSQLKEQIDGLTAQQDAKNKQIGFIKQELEQLRKLQTQGLVPLTRVLAMEHEQSRLDGEVGEIIASKAGAESKISEINVQTIQIQDDARSQTLTEMRDVESKIAELVERRTAAQAKLSRTEIKAPNSGTVYQVMVHTIGGVIAPGEALMLLVPEGDELVMQAQVSPHDIDAIHVGQPAQVRFPALKARMTPELFAEVIQVSADVSRTDQNTPPFYAVRLKLLPHEIDKLDKGQTLKPGMPAEAYIQTGARSALSFLLKPLADQIAHTFRET